MNIEIQFLAARNFVAGYPRNPATRVAYSDDGRYWEAFADEHTSDDDFKADALAYFTRTAS
jgi:hypothetical protein